MKFNKILFAFLFSSLILLFLLFFKPSQVLAAACSSYSGGASCYPNIQVCHADGGGSVSGTCSSGQVCCCPQGRNCYAPTPTPGGGTTYQQHYFAVAKFTNDNTYIHWEVEATYKQYTRGSGYRAVGTHDVWVANQSQTLKTFTLTRPAASNADAIHWYTSCVDPNDTVVTERTTSNCDQDDICHGVGYWEYAYLEAIDITCKPSLTSTQTYRGCGRANNNLQPRQVPGNDFNYVGHADICPTNTSDDCIKKGYVTPCSNGSCNNSCKRYSCDYTKSVSNWCQATTDNSCSSCAPACTTPSAPGGISASSSCNNNNNAYIDINWNNASGANSYDVRWKSSSSSNWNGPYSAAGSSYRINAGSISDNTNYDYQVRSVKSCGANSSWSGTNTIKSSNCTPPTATPTPTPACTTHQLTGRVFLDTNGNGVRNTGEPYQNGFTVEKWRDPNQGNNVTDCKGSSNYESMSTTNISSVGGNGSYRFFNTEEGSNYRVRLTIPNGYVCTTANGCDISNINLNQNRNNNFGIQVSNSTLTVHAFNDYNGNGAQDADDTDAAGITFTINGGNAQTTNNSGNRVLTNQAAGDYAIKPTKLSDGSNFGNSGWDVSNEDTAGSNTITKTLPPSQTVNLALHPPAPTCTMTTPAGNTTTTVNPGGTVQLTLHYVNPNGVTSTPDFKNWDADSSNVAGASISLPPTVNTGANTATVTWNAPSNYWATGTEAHPSGSACLPGTNRCGSCGLTASPDTGIIVQPLFSITGHVFMDTGKDGYITGDTDYTASRVRLNVYQGSSVGTSVYKTVQTPNGSGVYTFNSNLPQGQYTIALEPVPGGYDPTYPLGTPPSFTVRVGANCNSSLGSIKNAACDANGNISNLDFGINNSNPWIQSYGGDIWVNNLGSNPIPTNPTCGTSTGAYMSLSGAGGTPGIIFTGSSTLQYGNGQASADPRNWQVGGTTNITAEDYSPVSAGIIKSSYSYIKSLVTTNSTPTIELDGNYAGCSYVGTVLTCNTNSWASPLLHGVYTFRTDTTAGTLNLTGSGLTLTGSNDYVFLINGRFNIQEEIHVNQGSTALFTSSGETHVDSAVGVGSPFTSTTPNVEGWYSSDTNFIIDHDSTKTCPSADNRLNFAGSVVAGAALSGGSFKNNRDLCAADSSCPAFYIQERPDFILNAPAFLQSTSRIWREVAP